MTAPNQIERLLEVMRKLRDPEYGCPWDKDQTFETIAPYTIEEAYEVADAIAQADIDAIKDELGDLLFQVVFHARIAEEQGDFTFNDVANAITEKMIRRHPHVFGDVNMRSEAEQTVAWEEQKAAERGAEDRKTSALDGVALALPALMRAQKLQKRAARVGFDWKSIPPVYDKIQEEIEEVRTAAANADDKSEDLEAEIGDLIFACVNLARHYGIDAEMALRGANDKFQKRFTSMEQGLTAKDKTPADFSLDALEALWQKAKIKTGK